MPFSFDRAYDEDTEQKTLFEYVGIELLEHAFNGFNTVSFTNIHGFPGTVNTLTNEPPLSCRTVCLRIVSQLASLSS